MHVKCLEAIVYGPTGWGWKSERGWHPAWAAIEASVRRLDRFCYPFVHLWATEEEDRQVNDGTSEVLDVMGGEGVWWLGGSFGGYYQRRLDEPERGEAEVAVWTSDQGFADAERHICRDLDVVLRAVRYYVETSGFDPSLRWDEGL